MSAATMFPDERTNRRRKVILTVCLVLSVIGSLTAVGIRWESGADTQNQLVRVMYAVVTDYLDKNEGAWPGSWEDLEQMPPSGYWYEPVDYPLVKQQVEIDFDPDLKQMSGQPPREFTAIRAKNPVLDYSRDPRLVELLNKVREYHGSSPEVKSNQPEA
ncbi:hypothetical protein GYB59_11655 [bacterium]|nr:hypothetical protein [bacterium]